MDFTTILHVAKKNSTAKDSRVNYYSTKFSPPKKISKEKKLSDNIKKFLEKKEQEEREKARVEREKRDQLISSRDERSKNKIKKMLKVIKSANKSVLEDAVDNEHTAVTMQGPDQPDEDDYGYVSNEAAAFYQKYVDKVKDVKEDKYFSPSRPQSRNDLSGTKDRVRAAIVKDQEDKTNFTRVRVSSSSSNATYGSASKLDSNRHKDLYDPQLERELEDKRKKEEDKKKMIFKKPAPPPMDFQSLLKLAEKKQHEPIEVIVEDKSKKKPERLLSSKEKREMEERRKYFEEKEKRKKEGENKTNGRIPKLNGSVVSGSGTSKPSPAGTKTINQSMVKITSKTITSSLSSSLPKEPSRNPHISTGKPSQISHSNSQKPTVTNNNIKNVASSSSKLKPNINNSILQKGKQAVTSNIKSPINNLTNGKKAQTAEKAGTINGKTLGKTPYSGPTRQFPPTDLKSRQLPTTNNQKTRKFPPGDVPRSRQFPPSDVRRNVSAEKSRNKRRIIDDDDDEDEYDSELDDFIDDGEAEDDYSSHIKEIFGYDKSKYRDYDEDDSAMESTFAQQMREEFVSKKIGLMEDLEDMRQEAEEKKKKLQMKKRQKFN